MNSYRYYANEEVSTVAFKKDLCDNLSEECIECKLINQDETEAMNKLRLLKFNIQQDKEKEFRKLVGGTL